MADEKRDLEYANKIKMYNILEKQAKDLKSKSTKVKEEVAVMLHDDSTNEKMIGVDGVIYKVGYQGRTNKKLDHNALINMVGQTQYAELVTETRSEFMTIKKAPQGQQASVMNKAPNAIKSDLPPMGSLA